MHRFWRVWRLARCVNAGKRPRGAVARNETAGMTVSWFEICTARVASGHWMRSPRKRCKRTRKEEAGSFRKKKNRETSSSHCSTAVHMHVHTSGVIFETALLGVFQVLRTRPRAFMPPSFLICLCVHSSSPSDRHFYPDAFSTESRSGVWSSRLPDGKIPVLGKIKLCRRCYICSICAFLVVFWRTIHANYKLFIFIRHFHATIFQSYLPSENSVYQRNRFFRYKWLNTNWNLNWISNLIE